jgi:hypothetical protein
MSVPKSMRPMPRSQMEEQLTIGRCQAHFRRRRSDCSGDVAGDNRTALYGLRSRRYYPMRLIFGYGHFMRIRQGSRRIVASDGGICIHYRVSRLQSAIRQPHRYLEYTLKMHWGVDRSHSHAKLLRHRFTARLLQQDSISRWLTMSSRERGTARARTSRWNWTMRQIRLWEAAGCLPVPPASNRSGHSRFS